MSQKRDRVCNPPANERKCIKDDKVKRIDHVYSTEKITIA